MNTLGTDASWLPGNFDLRPQTIRVLRKAGLSKALLTNIFTEQGYWAKMGNQRMLHYNEAGELTSFGTFNAPPPGYLFADTVPEICYQYRCGWDTGVSFIHHVRTQKESVYFCINFPTPAMTRLKAIVKNRPSLMHRDFLVDSLVASDSLRQWQYEIGHRRDSLQSYV